MEESLNPTTSNAQQELPQEQQNEEQEQSQQGRNHHDTNNNKKRKRDNSKLNHFARAYQNVQLEPRISRTSNIQIPGVDHVVTTTRPGSPSRQFAHSYVATFATNNEHTTSAAASGEHCFVKQVIHQHVNGLCIVTAGLLVDLPAPRDETITTTTTSRCNWIDRIEFLMSPSDPCSAGERRKQQSKMLKGKMTSSTGKQQQLQQEPPPQNNSGIVTPDTVLAQLHLQNGTSIPLFAFCWGSILELNTQVTPQQLQDDPLLEGFLAVILPTGPFPPKECLVGTVEKHVTSKEKTEEVEKDSTTATAVDAEDGQSY